MVALRHTAGDLHVHQLARPWMAIDHLGGQFEPLLQPQRVIDANCIQAALQSREVGVRAKRRPNSCAFSVDGIDRDHFIDTVTENETAIEHRYLCVDQRGPLAVQVAGGLLPGTCSTSAGAFNSDTAFPPPQNDGIVCATHQPACFNVLERNHWHLGDLPPARADRHAAHRFAPLQRRDQRIRTFDR